MNAGALWYVSAVTRLSLEYLGARSSRQHASGGTLNGTDSSSNRAQLGVFAVLGKRFSIQASGYLGHSSGTANSTDSLGALATTSTSGTPYGGSATFSAYLTRALDLSLLGGFHGVSSSAADSTGASIGSTQSVPFVSPALEWWPTDELLTRVRYEFESSTTSSDGSPDTTVTSHTVTFSVGLRL